MLKDFSTTRFFKNNYFKIGLIIVASIVFMVILIATSNSKKLSRTADSNKSSNMRYVLVNQDQGSRFNGKNYNLGNDFVTLAVKDKERDWTTASADEARAGLAKGSYDIEVIIPEKFSSHILSLQATSPQKAGIVYHVKEGQNEVTNIAIQKNVNSLINYFNSRVIRMYFSSLINNLHDAQTNAQSMANHQSDLWHNFNLQVNNPFSELDGQFSQLTSTTSILSNEYSGYNSTQKEFINSLNTLLAATNKKKQELRKNKSNEDQDAGIIQQSPALDKNAEKLKDVVTNQRNVISKQKNEIAEDKEKISEKENQNKILQKNNTHLKDQLRQLQNSTTDIDINTFQNTTNTFNTLKNQSSELPHLINELTNQLDELTKIEGDFENIYGVKSDASIEDNTEKILNYISPVEGNKDILTNFNRYILDSTRALPEYKNIDKVDFKNVWDNNSIDEYLDAEKILQSFYEDQKNTYGINQEVIPLNEEDTETSTQITLNIHNGKNIIKFAGNKNIKVKSIEAINLSKNTKLSAYKNNKVIARVSKKNDKKLTTQENIPVLFKITYSFKPNQPTEFTWSVNNVVQNTGTVANFKQFNYEKINSDINKKIVAASQIVAIYGDSSTRTLKQYVEKIKDGKLYNFKDSLAYAVNPTDKKDQKTMEEKSADLARYYGKLTTQISNLEEILGKQPIKVFNKKTKHLRKISEALNEDGVSDYLNQSSKIIDWYEKASHLVENSEEDEIKDLTVSTNSLLPNSLLYQDNLDNIKVDKKDDSKIKEVNKVKPNSSSIYSIGKIDKNKKEIMPSEVLAQYTELQNYLKENSTNLQKELNGSGKEFQPAVKKLTATTKDLKNHTNDIMKDLNSNIKKGKNQVADNQKYTDAFKKVMSNTRAGDGNNAGVYNFLSNPVKAQGVYASTREQSILPYFMILVTFLSAAFISLGIKKYLPERKIGELDELTTFSKVWFNMPAVLTILGIGSLSGLIFGSLSINLVSKEVALGWLIYSIIVMTLLVSSFTIISLYNQNIANFIYLLLFGLFLILTPFTGMLTRTGSLLRALYVISPLQNLQNGFTVIKNGGHLGIMSVVGLLMIIGIVLTVGLFRKNAEMEHLIERNEV